MNVLEPHDSSLAEHLGRIAAGEGLPRIGGRMVGLLMTARVPLSIDELARQLEVSRASISTNGKLLESLALVERVARPGDRRDYLRVSGGDPSMPLLALGLRRLRGMRWAVRMARGAAARGSQVRLRLRRMERLYDLMIGRLQSELASGGRMRRP